MKNNLDDKVLLFKISCNFLVTISIFLEILNAIGYVKLSWWAILSPLWLPVLATICVLLLLYLVTMILSFFISFPEDDEF